jgi:hypothetical protein
MDTSPVETAIVDEQIWRAWVQKGKQRDDATARKARIVAGTAAAILAVVSGFYFLAMP